MRHVLIAMFAALLGGCSSYSSSSLSRQTQQGRLLTDGPPALMTAGTFADQQRDEVPLLYNFAIEANQVTLAAAQGQTVAAPATDLASQQAALQGVKDWGAVASVGEGYIDRQCQAFLAAIDRLEKEKKATLADINAIQSASVGIMGLALAAQKAIGITGIAFGLGASLFDNTTSTVLYQLPAAGISTIVEAQRQALRANEKAVLAEVTNQGLASARLGTYVLYCVPLTIESNISKVLSSTKADTANNTITSSTQPVLTSAATFMHAAAEKVTFPTEDAIWKSIVALKDSQVLALMARLKPMLEAAPPAALTSLNTFDPGGARYSDPAIARRILGIWVLKSGSLTAPDLQKIADTVTSVSTGG